VPFFYDKKNGRVALRSTLERISEHAQCSCLERWFHVVTNEKRATENTNHYPLVFLRVMFLPVWNSARIGSTKNQEEEKSELQ